LRILSVISEGRSVRDFDNSAGGSRTSPEDEPAMP